ncbi:MAG: glycosyltransferase family 4 protein [Limisphaerales bacterium]
MSADGVNVLHVVGGTELRGGTASFVSRLARLKIDGVTQRIWMHKEFVPPAESGTFVCGGTATQVNGSVMHDALAGLCEARALSTWLKREGRAVLHAHSRVGMVAASLAGRWQRAPVVLHCHFLPTRPWIYHWLRQHSSAEMIFNSPKTCRHFGAVPEKSFVMLPDVDWPGAPPHPGTGRLRFVGAGAFVQGKHLDVLIAAFRRWQASGGDAELALFGRSSTPDAPNCQRAIETFCAGDPAITLHPWSPDWARSLTAGDILVHLGEPESFGLVILEAFARGCRLVVLPQTFLDELPEPHGQAGVFRADALDAESVADALALATNQTAPPENLFALRRAAQGFFCMEQHAARLSSLYADMTRRTAT